eukprot:TRINITY_DN5951_c0_g1_i1.p1 TRINITY_DN5951_c0_g1~~TRINITY_DN5951_c0_g1_i1.p1  ORF type:complete len:725 (+),score=207.56 TRINITY_DN5951_c0_g1_i1:142-2316(+)
MKRGGVVLRRVLLRGVTAGPDCCRPRCSVGWRTESALRQHRLYCTQKPQQPSNGAQSEPSQSDDGSADGKGGTGRESADSGRSREDLIEEVFSLIGAVVGELPRAVSTLAPQAALAREAAVAGLSGLVSRVECVVSKAASVCDRGGGQQCPGVPSDAELSEMGLSELVRLAEQVNAPNRDGWKDRDDVVAALVRARGLTGSADLREDVRALREEVRELRRQHEHLVLLLRKRHGEEQTGAATAKAAASAAPEQPPADPKPEHEPDAEPARHHPGSKVPSTVVQRTARIGGLLWRLAFDAGAKRLGGRKGADGGVLSDQGLDMLVDRLCHMRGAALKLGQLLSIQDEAVVPPHVLRAFERVRDHAHCMPESQLRGVLCGELGADWEGRVLATLDLNPVAAASLGQVHKGTLPDGTAVAVKVQFPGIEDSVASDVRSLGWLFTLGFMPKGLYADKILRELRTELLAECDYLGEADRQTEFANVLQADPDRHGGLSRIRVPRVHRDASTRHVLTTDWAPGVPADRLRLSEQTVARDLVGEQLFLLTLKETFVWKMMQTDPNFANFLWDDESGMLSLVDFGAARRFATEFCEQYLLVVDGAAKKDRAQVVAASRELGFLTGEECEEMLDAHCAATFAIGTPFSHRGVFNFADFDLAAQVRPHVATMLRLRKTAPPKEVYSLHRRLSGLFLLLMKLGSRFDARRLWIDTLRLAQPKMSAEVFGQVNAAY